MLEVLVGDRPLATELVGSKLASIDPAPHRLGGDLAAVGDVLNDHEAIRSRWILVELRLRLILVDRGHGSGRGGAREPVRAARNASSTVSRGEPPVLGGLPGLSERMLSLEMAVEPSWVPMVTCFMDVASERKQYPRAKLQEVLHVRGF